METKHLTYCLASPEGKWALFVEAYSRGFLQALLNYPHFLTREQSVAPAMIEAILVKSAVCCMPTDTAYEQFFASIWASAYAYVAERFSERELVNLAFRSKILEEADGALASLKRAFASDEGQSELASVYTQMTQTYLGEV